MILTITPNTAIDITYTIDGFSIDKVHRPYESRTVAGGKGVNVVRVLKELGREGLATGFVGGGTGKSLIDKINEEGLPHDFVYIKNESRLCIAIIDPKNGTQTEVNENGPEVSGSELSDMMEKTGRYLPECDYVAMCGSCPPGVPISFYGDIIKAARKAGVKTVLDTSGEHLIESIKHGPYMVKPNLVELSQLAGREIITLEEAAASVKSLKRFGVEIAVVTMGRSGALVTDGAQVWMAVPPSIEFVSAVGSGDAFMAAFLHSLMNGLGLPEALVYGTAAGTANAATYGAGFCKKESIMDIRSRVTLRKID